MDGNNCDRKHHNDWADERLAQLAPPDDWQPNTDRALAHVNERRAKSRRIGSMWLWGAAVAAVTCACLLAFPTSRDVVQRLWVGRSEARMVYVGQVYAALQTLKDKQAAADFTLTDAQGSDVHLSDYRGKVVVINFWATWCPVCQQEIPWLVEFEQKYRSKGLDVIGVSMGEDGWTTLEPYLKAQNVNYNVVIGDEATAEAYGMSEVPMTFLIDREGKISAASVGVIDKDECEKEILRLLGN